MRNIAWLIAAGCTVVAQPATAHVTLEVTQAPTDSYYKATLRVSHGCKGSPTTRVRVRIPEGVTGVKPQPKQAWKVEITRVKLPTAVDDGHGGKLTETIGEVAWSGGPLADEHFDEFMMMMKLPDRTGATLYFPVVQECQQGMHRWIEIPPAGKSPHSLKEPAPALRLTPK
jgi:periplasmic copper chaperone A